MDSLTTALAGIVVLALPFAVWLRFAMRARRKSELDEIKKLATERSRWLDELHSRLDALDKQDSQRESTASEEATFSTSQLRELLLAYQTGTWRDIAARRYFLSWGTPDPEALSPEIECSYYDKLRYPRVVEAETGPEWVKDADPHESAQTFGSRRKIAHFTGLESRIVAG